MKNVSVMAELWYSGLKYFLAPCDSQLEKQLSKLPLWDEHTSDQWL